MQLTTTLPTDQIESILKTMLVDKPVTLLKSIPRMGRNNIAWIYVECEVTKKRRATFVSFAMFDTAFWKWLETAQIMALALWQRIQVARAVWHSLPIGVEVYHSELGWCELLGKNIDSHTSAPQFWVSAKDDLHAIDPALVREFLW